MPTVIVWAHGGNHVELEGSFDNWTQVRLSCLACTVCARRRPAHIGMAAITRWPVRLGAAAERLRVDVVLGGWRMSGCAAVCLLPTAYRRALLPLARLPSLQRHTMQRSGKDSTLVKLLPPGVYQVG